MLINNNYFYCENGEKLKSLMIEIYKLDKSTLYLNKDQKHLGRVILMYHEHKTALQNLLLSKIQFFLQS